jgi:prolyl-tRNA synthetase
VRSIDDLARMEGGVPAEQQIKTLVYVADGSALLVLLRGDQLLVEQKLADALGAAELRPASDAEIRAALGAAAGSLGAVGVRGLRVVADASLQGLAGMVTGANADGFHLRGVDVARDLAVDAWLDLRQVQAGEACPACEAELEVHKTIEVGHIFKLGTRYSEALGALVLDEAQASRPIVMGSYGIGIGRAMAAIAEVCHDAAGLVWPVPVAPWEVVVTAVNPKNAEVSDVSSGLYDALRAAGIEVLLDDRDERPGVKFNDADLIGIPYRLTVGPRGVAEGKVELTRRRGGESRQLDVHKAADVVTEAVLEDRSATA